MLLEKCDLTDSCDLTNLISWIRLGEINSQFCAFLDQSRSKDDKENPFSSIFNLKVLYPIEERSRLAIWRGNLGTLSQSPRPCSTLIPLHPPITLLPINGLSDPLLSFFSDLAKVSCFKDIVYIVFHCLFNLLRILCKFQFCSFSPRPRLTFKNVLNFFPEQYPWNNSNFLKVTGRI